MPITETLSGTHALTQQFESRFGTAPQVFRAPGRVNLIGDHTDYNDGFVMPAAINFGTTVAAALRRDRKLLAYSLEFREEAELDLELSAAARARGHWSDYVFGVAIELERSGRRLPGANLLIHGEVPMGSGLSSSAALEVSSAFALSQLAGHAIPLAELARLCQTAENQFVGARCGIMDQFISCHGRAGHAIQLDCRTLEHQPVPIPKSVAIVVANSMVRHSIAGGEYNQRRAQCEDAVVALGQVIPNVRALRDVSMQQLEANRELLSPETFRRCRHVITENERVLRAGEALQRGDVHSFGRMMVESHASLRDDYEVSVPELDLLVDLAIDAPGVLGSRITGGGFGGCTVSLVQQQHAAEFRKALISGYQQRTGKRPEVYVCLASDGVRRLS